MNVTTELTPIDLIDQMLEANEDIWELAVSIGASDEEEMSVRRWRHGDLAIRLDKRYGENSIAKFAAAIAVNTSTLKQRKVMSAYYPKDTRVSFPSLGYSHYRAAMKLGELNKALWALEKAESKQWPVFKFEELLKRLTGKRRNSDTVEGTIQRVRMVLKGDNAIVEISVKDSELHKFYGVTNVTIRAK